MNCPKCGHPETPRVEICANCGEAYSSEDLLVLRQLEFLLNETASLNGLEAWRAPHAEQLESLRKRLKLSTREPSPAVVPAQVPPMRQPAAPVQAVPTRSAEEIARELALVQRTLVELSKWYQQTSLDGTSLLNLRKYFHTQAASLSRELAANPVKIEKPAQISAVEQINYALEELPHWLERGVIISPSEADGLRNYLTRQRSELQLKFTPPVAPAVVPTRSAEEIARELGLVKQTLEELANWGHDSAIDLTSIRNLRQALVAQARGLTRELGLISTGNVQPPMLPAIEQIDFALNELPHWVEKGYLSNSTQAILLQRYLTRQRAKLLQLASPPTAAPEVATSIPASTRITPPTRGSTTEPAASVPSAPVQVIKPTPIPTRPAVVPKPPRPPINWAKVWERVVGLVVSGALLRGLLYLGAFMIVVSAVVLVVNFWKVFPDYLRLILIALVPTTFYLAGWIVRGRLKLPQAGEVLTGIGAALVAVDFAAVYQLGGLSAQISLPLYWFIASSICTGVYILTAWRMRGAFFAYLTMIAAGNALLAFSAVLNLPLEWRIASVGVASFGMVVTSIVLAGASGWKGDFAIPSRRLPQILIPAMLFIALVILLFVPGDESSAQAIIFLLAALAYGLLAWKFPAFAFAIATLITSLGAIVYGLVAVHLPIEWYATAAGLLCPVYLVIGLWMERRLTPKFQLKTRYIQVINQAGFGLVGLAIVGGLATFAIDVWAGVIALTIASLDLGWSAYRFRRPVLVLASAGLFIVPFSVGISHWLQEMSYIHWIALLMAGWAGLSMIYLGLVMVLRKAERYAGSLVFWAHALTACGVMGLVINYAVTFRNWSNGPTLIALGGLMLPYLASALLHDTGEYPAVSGFFKGFPPSIARSIYLWPPAALLPCWIAIAWYGTSLPRPWLGAGLAVLGLAYVGLGQLLARRKVEYRIPLHVYAYALLLASIIATWGNPWASLTALYISVAVIGLLAYVYREPVQTALAALLFIWPFQIMLNLTPLEPHVHSLAYALLATFGYLPLGLRLARVADKFAVSSYWLAYGTAAYALVASVLGRFEVYPHDVPWIGVVVPLVLTCQQLFSLYRFRHPVFAWTSVIIFCIAFGQSLTLLHILPQFDATAWVLLAFAYMLGERTLNRMFAISKTSIKSHWFINLCLPLGITASVLCTLGLALTLSLTFTAFLTGAAAPQGVIQPAQVSLFDLELALLAQALVVIFVALAARLYRTRWPLYLEPVLTFILVTLFFIGFDEILFGRILTSQQFALPWSGLALVFLVIAAGLDRARERYSHGLYLGAYVLAALAVGWSLTDRAVLVWTLGIGISAAIASAILTHFNLHRTWDDFIAFFFEIQDRTRTIVRSAFLWIAAWSFPVWCVLLLAQINVAAGWYWLGFGLPALVYLALALWLKRSEPVYAWPFYSAGQFFTALGLICSTPLTVGLLSGEQAMIGNSWLNSEKITATGFILLQTIAVVFYAASARIHRLRFFSHLAAWLAFIPYTLGWIMYSSLKPVQLSYVWIGLAALLVTVGFGLDRVERPGKSRQVRYAHGPYLAGYILACFALLWSVGDRIVNIYTLGAFIVIALISYIVTHYAAHRSFEDFIGFFWRIPGTVPQRLASTGFLFLAAYGFPVWLGQVLAYNEVPMAWRGLALALSAPLYIACGLATRLTPARSRLPVSPTWPLYSAGYALTAIGAMITFDNEVLAIYVLALDALVFAASAIIFRQSFWLYLSNLLVPVIVLLTLHHNAVLTAPWVAGLFMLLAFLYFGIGRLLDRLLNPHPQPLSPTGKRVFTVEPFSLPFYAPGYLLSAVALAVASGEKNLAIETYSAGVVLYALSAWTFHEPIFVYPAAWLAAVPYYLGMTLTTLPVRWYGLGWLPLILSYISVGRFVFERGRLRIQNLRSLASLRSVDSLLLALTSAAMPFYLLAYGLSVSMIALSLGDPLALTLAFTAGSALYLGSAALFRRKIWLYPGLLAAHLAFLSYFTISPSGSPAYFITIPFLGMTWVMALIGYAFSHILPKVNSASQPAGRVVKVGRWEFTIGGWPFLSNLFTTSWSQAFFIFTALDVLLWQYLALYGYETTLILAVGNLILLGLFAILWKDPALPYGTLALFLLGVGFLLGWNNVPVPDSFAWIGGIGFGLYLLARVAERAAQIERVWIAIRIKLWVRPLVNASVIFTAAAVIVTLTTVLSHMVAAAAALAFAGALYLAVAYRGRYQRLGYFAVAMLLVAWMLALIVRDIHELQLYAIPGGLYLTIVGFLERRRGNKLFSLGLESFGLAVLLLTSFIQSLEGGIGGLPYFVLLLVEAALVIWWGAVRRIKTPFFIGFAASAMNVVGQIVVLFLGGSTALRWIIILTAGLLAVTTAVFVERQRERIIARAQGFREVLEKWE